MVFGKILGQHFAVETVQRMDVVRSPIVRRGPFRRIDPAVLVGEDRLAVFRDGDAAAVVVERKGAPGGLGRENECGAGGDRREGEIRLIHGEELEGRHYYRQGKGTVDRYPKISRKRC